MQDFLRLMHSRSHFIVLISTVEKKWRDTDWSCGSDYPLADGTPAECDPDSVGPCCSDARSGECGNSFYHCYCENCIDYREVRRLTEDWIQAGSLSL